MTAQIHDTLIYNGEKHRISTEPLSSYLDIKFDEYPFLSGSTNCWRGYVATWQIVNDVLSLIKLKANAIVAGEAKEVGIEYLTKNSNEPLVADWFTGLIIAHKGGELVYIHAGYCTIFEKDIILEIEKGIFINSYEIDNKERAKKFLEEQKDNPLYSPINDSEE